MLFEVCAEDWNEYLDSKNSWIDYTMFMLEQEDDVEDDVLMVRFLKENGLVKDFVSFISNKNRDGG